MYHCLYAIVSKITLQSVALLAQHRENMEYIILPIIL